LSGIEPTTEISAARQPVTKEHVVAATLARRILSIVFRKPALITKRGIGSKATLIETRQE
jgi:hypothetical protein